MSRIDIAICVDQEFAMPLAVTVASIDSAAAQDDDIVVHVLHPGIDSAVRARVSSGLTRTSIRWHAVDERALGHSRPATFLPSASLYRMLLGEVLPAEIERVIYLDADIVVRGSLARLASVDLVGEPVGAVRDAASPWAAGPLGPDWRVLGLSPASPYFNAGMLVIDLTRWRAEGAGAACLAVLDGRHLKWGDQDALNTVFERRWTELPRRWNLQSVDADGTGVAWGLWSEDVAAAVADPAVVHFTGRIKPWMPNGPAFSRPEWYEVLDTTAWQGWRPRVRPEKTVLTTAIGWGRTMKRSLLDRPERLPR